MTAGLKGLIELNKTRVDFYLNFKDLERQEKIQVLSLLF